MDAELDKELASIDFSDVDTVGVKDVKRRMILERAIELSENILIEYSDNEEELNWFTIRMAEVYLEKIATRLQSRMLAEDLRLLALEKKK